MHELLEDYLFEVKKQLAALPPEKREAELREIRWHLQLMFDDFIEIGDSPDEAAQQALQQFRSTSRKGRALQTARYAERMKHLPALMAALAALLVYVAAFSLWWMLFSAGVSLPGRMSPMLVGCIFFLASGFFGGRIAEAVAPRKAVCSVAILHLSVLLVLSAAGISDGFAAVIITLAGLAACWGTQVQQKQAQTRKPRAHPGRQRASMISD